MKERSKKFAQKTLDVLAAAQNPQEYYQKMSELIEAHDRETLESVRNQLVKE